MKTGELKLILISLFILIITYTQAQIDYNKRGTYYNIATEYKSSSTLKFETSFINKNKIPVGFEFSYFRMRDFLNENYGTASIMLEPGVAIEEELFENNGNINISEVFKSRYTSLKMVFPVFYKALPSELEVEESNTVVVNQFGDIIGGGGDIKRYDDLLMVNLFFEGFRVKRDLLYYPTKNVGDLSKDEKIGSTELSKLYTFGVGVHMIYLYDLMAFHVEASVINEPEKLYSYYFSSTPSRFTYSFELHHRFLSFTYTKECNQKYYGIGLCFDFYTTK